jgi:hypothetical protein
MLWPTFLKKSPIALARAIGLEKAITRNSALARNFFIR